MGDACAHTRDEGFFLRACARVQPFGSAYTESDAPPGHVLAKPDALAVAYVSLLLQVLRLRHPQGAPVRPRAGARDSRRSRAQAGQGAAGAPRLASRGQPGGARTTVLLRARRLHRLCRLDLRASTRKGTLAANQLGSANPSRLLT